MIGTAAHEMIEMCLRTEHPAEATMDLTASNGIQVDQEMVDAISLYLEDVRAHPMCEVLIEWPVSVPQIHPSLSGTLDAARYDRSRNRVIIWDYKHGRRFVPAEWNFQLICYSLGLINHFRIEHDVEFEFRIVQPRCFDGDGPIRSWVTSTSELMPIYEQLRVKAHEALNGTPTLTTGDHCRYCPAVGVCSAARTASYNILEFVDQAFSVDEMSDAEVGYEYDILDRALKIIKSRRDALADDVRHRVESGSAATGYGIGRGRGKWVWRDEEAALGLAKMFGVDAETRSVKTFAQVRDSLPAAQRRQLEDLKNFYAEHREGAVKLVPHKDTLAAKVFGRKNG
jgi:hypothetical protein